MKRIKRERRCVYCGKDVNENYMSTRYMCKQCVNERHLIFRTHEYKDIWQCITCGQTKAPENMYNRICCTECRENYKKAMREQIEKEKLEQTAYKLRMGYINETAEQFNNRALAQGKTYAQLQKEETNELVKRGLI